MCIFLHWFGENWLPLLTIHLYSSSIFNRNKVISELQVHNTFKNKPTNESNNIFVYNYFFVISLRMYGQNTECKSCLESWLHPQCGLLFIWNTAKLTLFLYLFHVGSFSLTFFFFELWNINMIINVKETQKVILREILLAILLTHFHPPIVSTLVPTTPIGNQSH